MKILVIAPHADDETLGMGGTIARLGQEGHRVVVAVMTGHGDEGAHPLGDRGVWDRVRAEAGEAMEVLGVQELIFREIPAVGVAEEPLWKLNRVTGELIEQVAPQALYVPFPLDLHRDQRPADRDQRERDPAMRRSMRSTGSTRKRGQAARPLRSP